MEFTSHAQAGQDRFVWEVTGHKTNGVFLDVGANHPISVNNTYALEKLGWKGIMVDIERISGCGRKSPYLKADATKINWLFQLRRYGLPRTVNYMSLDVDNATLPALMAIPLDRIRFNIITIEHDSYRLGPKPRDQMRSILKRAGYDLVCEDAMIRYPEGETNPFEDWWVSPDLSKKAKPFRSKSKLWSEILSQA